MPDLSHASNGIVAEWRQLGEDVCKALNLAGLPAHWRDDVESPAGAELEIDRADDEMGGLFC